METIPILSPPFWISVEDHFAGVLCGIEQEKVLPGDIATIFGSEGFGREPERGEILNDVEFNET